MGSIEAARAAVDASVLSGFGVLLFLVTAMPLALAEAAGSARLWRALRRLAAASLALSWPASLLWLWLKAGAMAGEPSLGAVWLVLRTTWFGQLIAAGVAASVLALVLAWAGRGRLAAGVAGLGVAVLALHGHGLAMEGGFSLLVAVSVLHVLAAGAWLGGLVPLLMVVRRAPAEVAARVARAFSPLGKWCVGVMALTAGWQFWVMVGGLPGLVGTSYGWMVAAKAWLFVLLTVLAVLNRYRLALALRGARARTARLAFTASLAGQIAAGLAVVAVAATLSGLTPAMHEQPDWPFPLRPSLVALDEPETRDEVVPALAELGFGLALVGIGVWRRRTVAVAAGVVVVGMAVPHLDLLFVPATPTSYFVAPETEAAMVARGETLFAAHCAACHGPARDSGAVMDLAAAHLLDHADGELFWWVAHGIDRPRGGQVMPGFAAVLDDADIWAVIAFVRARNPAWAGERGGSGHRH